MADVAFIHGEYHTIDYTPAAGAVAVGEVVLLGAVGNGTGGAGAIAGVAHRPIANNALGALAVGGAVYSGINLNNAAVGAKVYWDDSANKFTTASTNNSVFGVIVANGAGGANTTCRVLHNPFYGGN